MAHRIFVDSTGVKWEAWDVVGALWDRRLHADRRAGTPSAKSERAAKRRVERRNGAGRRGAAAEHQPPSWLAFEAPHEKRRLQPRPEGWERLADSALERLLAVARIVPKRRSRLIE
ncbi:MAG TPA: hypothetical protein VNA89_02275 [Gemmatimonadaceae bacterium]|nr:hypothetical protein [Gemmatimonadaceae bacterium]